MVDMIPASMATLDLGPQPATEFVLYIGPNPFTVRQPPGRLVNTSCCYTWRRAGDCIIHAHHNEHHYYCRTSPEARALATRHGRDVQNPRPYCDRGADVDRELECRRPLCGMLIASSKLFPNRSTSCAETAMAPDLKVALLEVMKHLRGDPDAFKADVLLPAIERLLTGAPWRIENTK